MFVYIDVAFYLLNSVFMVSRMLRDLAFEKGKKHNDVSQRCNDVSRSNDFLIKMYVVVSSTSSILVSRRNGENYIYEYSFELKYFILS